MGVCVFECSDAYVSASLVCPAQEEERLAEPPPSASPHWLCRGLSLRVEREREEEGEGERGWKREGKKECRRSVGEKKIHLNIHVPINLFLPPPPFLPPPSPHLLPWAPRGVLPLCPSSRLTRRAAELRPLPWTELTASVLPACL